MPEWKYVQGAWSTKVFNIQSATTTRRHQFAFQDGMTTILFLFRWYQLGHFVVHHYVSVFGMQSSLCDLMLSCNLDLLSVTESWLTSYDSTTIADLTNSLADYTVYHLPRSTRRGGGPAVIARKGLHVLRNKSCVLSSFEHFDLTITSGDKVSRLLACGGYE